MKTVTEACRSVPLRPLLTAFLPAAAAFLLTGGTLIADVWMPENIVYQLWEGTITARGVRYWPETHVLSDTVTIVDPLDTEAADE